MTCPIMHIGKCGHVRILAGLSRKSCKLKKKCEEAIYEIRQPVFASGGHPWEVPINSAGVYNKIKGYVNTIDNIPPL